MEIFLRQEILDQFHTLFENALDGVIAMDESGRIIYWNRQSEKIFGLSKNEALGQRISYTIMSEACRAEHELRFKRLFNTRDRLIPNLRLELTGLRKDNSEFPFEISVCPIRSGDRYSFYAFVRDITDRKRTEAILRSQADRVKSVVDHVIDGIITIDENFKIDSWNPAAKKISGYEEMEVIGKNVNILMPEPYHSQHDTFVSNYLRTGIAKIIGIGREVAGKRKDGSTFPMDLAVSEFRLDNRRYFTGIVRDITERKQAEEMQLFLTEGTKFLSESIDYETILKRIAQAAAQGIGDSCIVQVLARNANEPTFEIASASPEQEAMLREIMPKVFSDPTTQNINTEVLKKGKSMAVNDFSAEMFFPKGNRSEIRRSVESLGIKSLMVVPLAAHEKILGTMSVVSTGQSRRYEKRELVVFEELARRAAISIENSWLYKDAQAAIQARDEFLSVASHELKTPLTALKLQLQIGHYRLQKAPTLPSPMGSLIKAFGVSIRQVNALTRLVDELLDVSRIQTGHLTLELSETNLSSVIHDVMERHAGQLSSVKCTLSLDVDDTINGSWDRLRIEQVLVNLMGNIVKYAPGSHVKISAQRKHDMAELIVEDNGPGIPIEKQARLFERFERGVTSRNISGLGLGLYVSRWILEAHRGSIRLKSNPGKGAKFIIELPCELNLPKASGE